MPPHQKKAVLQQWRTSHPSTGPRFLVIFDVSVKPPEIPWAPLVINFDLPRSVEGYAQRAAAAVPPNPRGQGQGQGQGAQNGVIVSFVQAAGGDVEMLRSTECAYRFKVGVDVCPIGEGIVLKTSSVCRDTGRLP
jgi:translation initiation factor 4A